jgi:hypothetical protein
LNRFLRLNSENRVMIEFSRPENDESGLDQQVELRSSDSSSLVGSRRNRSSERVVMVVATTEFCPVCFSGDVLS